MPYRHDHQQAERLREDLARELTELESRARELRASLNREPRPEPPPPPPPRSRWWLGLAGAGLGAAATLVAMTGLRTAAMASLARAGGWLGSVAVVTAPPRPVAHRPAVDAEQVQRVFAGEHARRPWAHAPWWRRFILEESAHQRRIAPALWDEALARSPAYSRRTHLTAVKEGEETVGLRLLVQEDDLWSGLGFENGDVIRSINGYSLADPHEALATYEALRDARELHVHLTRDEEPVVLVLHIDHPL